MNATLRAADLRSTGSSVRLLGWDVTGQSVRASVRQADGAACLLAVGARVVPADDVWGLCSLQRLRAQYDANNNNFVDLTEFSQGAAAAAWTQGACRA
jgi:hypothetical protein